VTRRRRWCAAWLAVFVAASTAAPAAGHQAPSEPLGESDALRAAQLAFFNGRYLDAAAAAQTIQQSRPDELAAIELRTSALLFQIRRTLGSASKSERKAALARCEPCAEWTAVIAEETARARSLARSRLSKDRTDETALFFLAKIDLTYLWLQLEPLGRKKGWNEYWEARRSLDLLLDRNPLHVRARVARAWIDYIVDTRLPKGTRWLLGGGNRERALETMRRAAAADADIDVRAEAAFALWEMEVREKNIPAAVEVVRRLYVDFPGNRDVVTFLERHDPLFRATETR
jgi:hypothetical protein